MKRIMLNSVILGALTATTGSVVAETQEHVIREVEPVDPKLSSLRHTVTQKHPNLGVAIARPAAQDEVKVPTESETRMLRSRSGSLSSMSSDNVDEKSRRELDEDCIETTVDFSKTASGSTLRGGMYVYDEWKTLGLTLSSVGGYGTRPRLFDTAYIGNKYHGDADLGSPNRRCTPSGPGKGEGGEPDEPGANCDYLGNVLIIQEDNDDLSIPDDNSKGGQIIFRFSNEGQTVYDIGLLDVDYETKLKVKYRTDDGLKRKKIHVPLLGNNSYQKVAIDTHNVVQIKLVATRSAAVSFITFCRTSNEAETSEEDTYEQCVDRLVDFSESAKGSQLQGGMYVDDEWSEIGLTLSCTGGYGSRPRLFDTSNPGTVESGDPDLGSPNELCSARGPGSGSGGVPGAEGENCKPLGNVLIIQEENYNLAIPDDNVDGGTIKFVFAPTTAKVYDIGLLDVDYDCSISVFYEKGKIIKEKKIKVPLLGDNSVQIVSINKNHVKQIELYASRSAAVTFLSFCHSSGKTVRASPPLIPSPTGDPTAAPTLQPARLPTPPPVLPVPDPTLPPTPVPIERPEEPPVEPPVEPPTPKPTPAPTPAPTLPPVEPPDETPVDPPTPKPTPAPTPLPTLPPTNPGGLELETNSVVVDRNDATATINVVRKNGFDGTVSVDYTTVADTATPGDDYVSKSGTLVFGDGEDKKSIVITLIPNDQATEEFKITIDNNEGAELLAPRTATVMLVGSDDEMIEMEQAAPPVDPNSVEAVDLFTGIKSPTHLAWLPDGTMLIATKPGIVYVSSGITLDPTPFIDIQDIVNNRNDRGLISIALHPDFISKPYVYLLYAYEGTDNVQELQGLVGTLAGPDGKGARAGRLMRVTASAADNYRSIVPGSEVILLGTNSIRQYFNPYVDLTSDFAEPQGGFENGAYVHDFVNSDSLSHSVGGLAFHPDGSLLVSLGDGASYNRVDPRAWRVMDENSLAGKVLRIDPDTGKGLSSNPYYSQTNDANANSAKVWQMGIRNSFRITADQDSGLLYLGEVGWTKWEEVNRGGSGANFGWPYYEGVGKLDVYADTPLGEAWAATGAVVTPPILELNHQSRGINAIVLGDILSSTYYGAKFSGALFFNDLGQGILRYIKFDGAGNIQEVEVFATGAERVVSIQEGPDGILYYCNVSKNTVGRWERK